jgi:hypothetical protein
MEFWMDEQGEISVAQGQLIPPFERWSFSTNHYIQFLQDQLAVYSVLKDVIAAVKNSKSSGNAGPRSSGDGSSSQAVRAVTLFDTVLGLDRTKVSYNPNSCSVVHSEPSIWDSLIWVLSCLDVAHNLDYLLSHYWWLVKCGSVSRIL